MSNRPLAAEDFIELKAAMEANTFHPGQNPAKYADGNAFVYEDEQGIVGFLHYTKVLRLRTTWVDNGDRTRNGPSIFEAINETVKLAKANGYTEVIFQTDNEALGKFCTNKLGFEESPGEYRLEIPKEEAKHV